MIDKAGNPHPLFSETTNEEFQARNGMNRTKTPIIIPPTFQTFQISNHYDNLHVQNLTIQFDVVTLSYDTKYTMQFFQYLDSLFDTEPNDTDLYKGGYRKHRRYSNERYQIEVLYDRKRITKGFTVVSDTIKLHSPDDTLIEIIRKFFRYKTEPKISSMEIAFDFHCDESERKDLLHYLERVLYLTYAKKPPFVFYGEDDTHTSYSQDQKDGHTSRLSRLYDKSEEDEIEEQEDEEDEEEASLNMNHRFVRMEIVLRRKSLCRKSINVIDDLNKIWRIDLSDIFAFKQIDCTMLFNYLYKRRKARLFSRLRKTRWKRTKSRFRTTEFKQDLLLNMTQVHMSHYLSPYRSFKNGYERIERLSVQAQVWELKKRKIPYNRFLVSVNEPLFALLQSRFPECHKG